MATIASLAVSITTRTKKFMKGMRKVRWQLRKTTAVVKTLSKRLVGLGTLATGGGLGVLGNRAIQTADSLDKVSLKLGINIQRLQELQFAAERTGVPVRQFNLGIQRMTRRISEAAQGMGEAKAAIAELGLSAQKLNSLTIDEQFKAIADAMELVTSQNDKIRLGFKLFDSEGVALINTLAAGREGLDGFAKQAQALGVITEKAAKKLVSLKDAFGRLSESITKNAAIALAEWAPAIERVVNTGVGLLKSLKDINLETVKGIAKWAAWVAGIGAAIVIIPHVVSSISAVITIVKALISSQILLTALAGPAGWLIIGAAIAGTAVAIEASTKLIGDMGTAFDDALASAEAFGEGVKKAAEMPKRVDPNSPRGRPGPGGLGTAVGTAAANVFKEAASITSKIINSQPMMIAQKRIDELNKALAFGGLSLKLYVEELHKVREEWAEASGSAEAFRRKTEAYADSLSQLQDKQPSTAGPARVIKGREINPFTSVLGFGKRKAVQKVEEKNSTKAVNLLASIDQAMTAGLGGMFSP